MKVERFPNVGQRDSLIHYLGNDDLGILGLCGIPVKLIRRRCMEKSQAKGIESEVISVYPDVMSNF